MRESRAKAEPRAASAGKILWRASFLSFMDILSLNPQEYGFPERRYAMSEKKQPARKPRAPRDLDLLFRLAEEDNSDVDGSYTGTPKDGGQPVQDADDL